MMYPLILSTTLSFLSVHSSLIGKQILKWINRPSGKENQLLSQKFELKSEQSKMNITDDFAKYSKIQRRINTIDEELSLHRNDKNSLTLQLGLTYGLKFALGIMLVVLSIYYRYSPRYRLNAFLTISFVTRTKIIKSLSIFGYYAVPLLQEKSTSARVLSKKWGKNKKHRNIKLNVYFDTMADPKHEEILAPLRASVKEQGDLVRQLKAEGAPVLDVKKGSA
ncbi:hypothetical protein NQ318_019621 [Aromia moschata]|uniref:Guided entry of tail-anchored proteins factor 1 n=1 Tax=Aromia moschata TaxID=1265417 RepID=A0AAV8Z6K0_9CUCU|nr:hypothetical protein NQ318_019621 [Aromia moschata]